MYGFKEKNTKNFIKQWKYLSFSLLCLIVFTLKNNIYSFEIMFPKIWSKPRVGSSINTKFRSSKRTIGIDGADAVLGPDIVIAWSVLLQDMPRGLRLSKGHTIQDFKNSRETFLLMGKNEKWNTWTHNKLTPNHTFSFPLFHFRSSPPPFL